MTTTTTTTTATHYETLGVPKSASQNEIKRIFRELSLQYHPDLKHAQQEKQAGAELFKSITNAHSILSSPSKRIMYDQQLVASASSSAFRGRAKGWRGTQQMTAAIWKNPRLFFYGIGGAITFELYLNYCIVPIVEERQRQKIRQLGC